ncbi:zinc-binding metallopeptidase family protein [Herbaspirillum autotrophicum]|uniref:zinc-binding metallopeptidase family protein n=1 Tax=Herbaspirillum autotrophicum TaxID=180195 RepID=UPI00067BBCF2|nr:putative zinc-binding metallopeptidase [Herbaspirillum autotrophicum]
MKTFHCDNCASQVFFENTLCEHCGWLLGCQPEFQIISSFAPAADVTSIAGDGSGAQRWRSINPVNQNRLFRQCRNYVQEEVCNWMIDDADDNALCASCRLTSVIPSLATEQNRILWKRLEVAKRRLLHTLWTLQLQPMSKPEDPRAGLTFEFLEDVPHGPSVLTGHAAGVITINVAEADPAYREQMRAQMAEPYRTLLGHFRHESGHYYFDRLIAGTPDIDAFRRLFGDETANYGDSLQRHYDNGPPPDWNQQFVSVYASSHPWEDWAETWAHYLHMFDTLETAYSCGVQLRPKNRNEQAMTIDSSPVDALSFDELSKEWFALTYVLNSLNRSIGMPDSYPFTLTTPVLLKLAFVHEVVMRQAHREPEPGAQA